MTIWGVFSGFIIGMLYTVLVTNFMSRSLDFNMIEALLNPALWRLALRYGAVSGGIIGLISGLNIWYMMRKINLPYMSGKIDRKSLEVYVTTPLLATLAGFVLVSVYFSTMSIFFLLPPFMAGIVATYAAHRYMDRLREWSRSIPSAASKAKNEIRDTSRLRDTASEQLYMDDMIEPSQSLSDKRS